MRKITHEDQFCFKKLDDINIYDIGNTIQMVGVIWAGGDHSYLCLFPDDSDEDYFNSTKAYLDMDLDDWKKFIRQTDIKETEILAQDTDAKLHKAILRKTQRQIEQGLQWRVFKRDGYKCRYCGIDGVPMTVDHLVLWEEGGPTIEENLVTACRKCNKKRGNMQYETWLCSDYYSQRMINLSEEVRVQNIDLAGELQDIPRQYHKKSR